MYFNTNDHDLEKTIKGALDAFDRFKKCSVKERGALMRFIAKEIDDLDDELIDTAHEESNLPKARLVNEKGRTVFQWLSYAEAIESGVVLDLRIDTALPDRVPPRPDIRKGMVPLGPIVVFGASNFPFAFSTAGGDTASAIAAGNPVIVKAHPAHPKTARLMGNAISTAIEKFGLPQGVFSQVYGDEKVGGYLARHEDIKAISFTGSYSGGKALFDLANKREKPIPVFAEMGSVNPLFLLPSQLKSSAKELAAQYVASLTLGVGQFCTNPGLLVAVECVELTGFIQDVQDLITESSAGRMLHHGIAANYLNDYQQVIDQEGVEVIANGIEPDIGYGRPAVAKVAGTQFLKNRVLSQEVFGPFGLIVGCKDRKEMESVASALEGQLTVTLFADDHDIEEHLNLISILQDKCGRFSFNNFPTGVEVCFAMQHGGPFPASTDSRFGSVGADAIKRFMRPLSFQNWPEKRLPLELQNANPLQLQRTVNNLITKDII